jgi:hypothetical protein
VGDLDPSECCQMCLDTSGCAAMYYIPNVNQCVLISPACGQTEVIYFEHNGTVPNGWFQLQAGCGGISYGGIN